MTLKWLVYLFFAALYVLVTFFGIGPVLLADGSDQERMITLIIVLLIYVVITIALRYVIKKMKH